MRFVVCPLRLAEQLSLFGGGETEVHAHVRRTKTGAVPVRQHTRKVRRSEQGAPEQAAPATDALDLLLSETPEWEQRGDGSVWWEPHHAPRFAVRRRGMPGRYEFEVHRITEENGERRSEVVRAGKTLGEVLQRAAELGGVSTETADKIAEIRAVKRPPWGHHQPHRFDNATMGQREAWWLPEQTPGVAVMRQESGRGRDRYEIFPLHLNGDLGEKLSGYANLDEVKGYLAYHLEINDPIGQERARKKQEREERRRAMRREQAARDGAARELDNARAEVFRLANELDRLDPKFAAQTAEARQTAEESDEPWDIGKVASKLRTTLGTERRKRDRETGEWMQKDRTLSKVQRTALLAALDKHKIARADSYIVFDYGRTIRNDQGGSWKTAFDKAARWLRQQNEVAQRDPESVARRRLRPTRDTTAAEVDERVEKVRNALDALDARRDRFIDQQPARERNQWYRDYPLTHRRWFETREDLRSEMRDLERWRRRQGG